MNKQYLLFQAYGTAAMLSECRLAILQFLEYNDQKGICLVLYTDNASYFSEELKAFDQSIVEILTPDLIKEWRGEIDFVFRVKIKMLQHFFSHHNGSLLYCDIDTCCKKSILPLFDNIENGNVYMHTNEGLISQPANLTIKKWQRFLAKKAMTVNDNITIDINDIAMWNAGVIGIHSNKASLLQDVLYITEFIHPAFPNHTVEQFAFSYVFQKNAPILAAENYIFHYWDLKEYRNFLHQFFAANEGLPLNELAKRIIPFLPEPIMTSKTAYKKLPFLKKVFTKKWDFNSYMMVNKKTTI